MSALDLFAATGLPFAAIDTRRGEFFVSTATGSIVVARVRRRLRVTVFDGQEIRRGLVACDGRAVADFIASL